MVLRDGIRQLRVLGRLRIFGARGLDPILLQAGGLARGGGRGFPRRLGGEQRGGGGYDGGGKDHRGGGWARHRRLLLVGEFLG
jgi:hypothetical protein